MEDALAPFSFHFNGTLLPVLILVVMEDALAPHHQDFFLREFLCLNPCCNGRCTRTDFSASKLVTDYLS